MLSIQTKSRNALLFTLLATVWGSAFVAIKAGLEVLPPLLFAALRYDVAGAALLGYALLSGGQWRPRGRDEWTLVGVGGALVIGAHFAFLFVGQQYVTSGMAAVVLSTTPVLTPLFAWVLLPNERLGPAGVVGLALGLLGVVLIASPDPNALDGTAYGTLLLALSAASFALGAVLVQRLPARMPLAPAQAWMMLLGAGLLHAGSVAFGEETVAAVSWTPDAVAGLFYLALVCGAGGFVVYFDLQERVGPVEISLVNYAVPVAAAGFGFALLDEPITAGTVVGFAVIALGFALLKGPTMYPFVVELHARYDRGYAVENEYLPDAEPFRSSSGGLSSADD